MQKILAINPGSTSTKIAVFENETEVFVKNIKHSSEELAGFASIIEQNDFRKETIYNVLKENNIDITTINVVIGRGGLVKPIPSGTYEVNDLLKEHLTIGYSGQHASNLGGLIADNIAQSLGIGKAYIADPVVVDELQPLARIAGHPKFERKSIFHALNQKAIAKGYAKDIEKDYEELNLIVAHLGGGVSVGAHRKGEVLEVNQALDGEGPFSPERSCTLPTGQLVDMCFSGEYTKEEVKKIIVGAGGYVGYFGTNDAYKIELDAKAGDEKAILIQDAMSYQVANAIGEAASVLEGKVDAILITGGIAYGKPVVEFIEKHVKWIAPVKVYAGEDEMKALAINAYKVATQQQEVKIYQ